MLPMKMILNWVLNNVKSRFCQTQAKGSFVILLCLNFLQGSAQSTDSIKKWHFNTDVYLMLPNMDGETGIGNTLTVPIDANTSDIFSKLKMAGMIYFETKTEKWAITNDFVYMKLNQDITPTKLWNSGEVSVKEFIWETAGLYRIIPFLEVGLGGRLTNLAAEIDTRRYVPGIGNPTEEVSESSAKTWFDPILITRLATDIYGKWLFQFRGDVGGFGVGSDFTWQLQAYAGYRFTKVFQLSAGYRILGVDCDKGDDIERFVYNVDTFGPVVRMGFNF
jgi:hypothetical protein